MTSSQTIESRLLLDNHFGPDSRLANAAMPLSRFSGSFLRIQAKPPLWLSACPTVPLAGPIRSSTSRVGRMMG
jgi:hypothetical protein